MNNELTQLRSILIKTKFPKADCLNYPVLFDDLSKNPQKNFIKVLEYFFKEYDLGVIDKILEKHPKQGDFLSLEGANFVSCAFKILRDYFNVKLNLQLNQFNNEKKFLKAKVIFCTSVASTFYKCRTKKRKPFGSSNLTNNGSGELSSIGSAYDETRSDDAVFRDPDQVERILIQPGAIKNIKDDGLAFYRENTGIEMSVHSLEDLKFSRRRVTSNSVSNIITMNMNTNITNDENLNTTIVYKPKNTKVSAKLLKPCEIKDRPASPSIPVKSIGNPPKPPCNTPNKQTTTSNNIVTTEQAMKFGGSFGSASQKKQPREKERPVSVIDKMRQEFTDQLEKKTANSEKHNINNQTLLQQNLFNKGCSSPFAGLKNKMTPNEGSDFKRKAPVSRLSRKPPRTPASSNKNQQTNVYQLASAGPASTILQFDEKSSIEPNFQNIQSKLSNVEFLTENLCYENYQLMLKRVDYLERHLNDPKPKYKISKVEYFSLIDRIERLEKNIKS